MKKYSFLFKVSSLLAYLFFLYGLSPLTAFLTNYWQFSSRVGNFIWVGNGLLILFSCLVIWILIKSGNRNLFRIQKNKWLQYLALTLAGVVVLLSFNTLTNPYVQSTNEFWNSFIAYSETNFAELGVYVHIILLGPLTEELVFRGLLQHAFFKNSRFGLDILLPSLLFASPHFFTTPSLIDILVYTTIGSLLAFLTRYSKSIYPSYTIHIVNNTVANLPFLLTFLRRVLAL